MRDTQILLPGTLLQGIATSVIFQQSFPLETLFMAVFFTF